MSISGYTAVADFFNVNSAISSTHIGNILVNDQMPQEYDSFNDEYDDLVMVDEGTYSSGINKPTFYIDDKGYVSIADINLFNAYVANFEAGQTEDLFVTYKVINLSNNEILEITNMLTIHIFRVNDAPQLDNDTGSVFEDGVVTVAAAAGLLANDSDPDSGDSISVVGARSIGGVSFDAEVTDTYGTLRVNSDGSYSFTADGDASNALAAGTTYTDTFEYQVKDAAGLTSNAQLSITITGDNDAPKAVDDDFAMEQNQTINGTLFTNDTDSDFGDAFRVSSINYYSLLIPMSGNSITINDVFGTLNINTNGTISISADGTASKNLSTGQIYITSIKYTIKDGSNDTSTAKIDLAITGVNDAPNAEGDSADALEDATVTIILLDNDSDPDTGDVLHVSGISKSSTDDFVTTFIKDDYGTLTLNEDGTVNFQADGSASQALAAGAIATDIFTYQIMDAAGLPSTATMTLTITGVNDAPIASNDSYSYTNTLGSIFTVDAADGVLKHLDAGETVGDSDVDSGDTLAVVVGTDPIETTAGQKVTLAADGSFVYDAVDGFYGQDSFNYTVSDGNDGTSTATVNLTVTAPPKLADLFLINEIAVNTGAVTFTINTDNGADPNTVTTGPAHIEIIKSSNTATSSADLRSMQVEIVNPDGGLSVISMSQLVGLTVDKAGNVLNLSSVIPAGGSLGLFEPNSSGLGIWAVYDSKGTLKLSGTYHDNAWELGADVTAPVAVNLAQAQTGASFDLFIANDALISNLQSIDINKTQSWLSGVGSLGTAPHALGSVSPFVLPEKEFAWYGGAQLSPLGVPADVTALLIANQQFNGSLASSADTVFVRVYDNYLHNGTANGLDKVFIDNNDAGDWSYGPKTILTDGYKNLAGKSSTKFVANPLDPYDNMNPLQGTGKHGDVIASITNEDGQTIAIFSGFGTGGIGHDFLYGVNSDDLLLGASGDDFIYGSGGNDILWGGSGGDSLSGGAGNDGLYGGTGKDKLSGGIGADIFAFQATNESSVALFDVIDDFTVGVDKIDLSAIDARTSISGNQAFAFGGSTTAVKANSVTWYESNGNTIIQIDNTGNTFADMQLVLAGVSLGLTSADFIL